ncbi:MAG: two-component system cell cycle sensor histidine kinase/response regulator CckA, partial [Myxococcota bacterium]
TSASVWLRSAENPTSGPAYLRHAIPTPREKATKPLPASHPLMARLEADSAFSCTTNDPNCQSLLRGIVYGNGAVTFYRLGRVGLLCLFVADAEQPWDAVQLRRLRNVVDKFSVSIEGCLAHQRVLISENRYRSLFESSRDTVFISSPNGRFVDINPAGVRMFGYESREELLAADISRDIFLTVDDWKRYRQTLGTAGHVKDHELILRHESGEQLVVLETSSATFDDAGAISSIRGILRDVTEQRALEMQLVQAQKMESLGLLAGGIAHDFNNILCGILGYASLLTVRLQADEKSRRQLQTIEQSARRAQDLTSQLLGFARGGKYNPTAVQIGDVLTESLALLDRLIGQHIEIRTRLQPGLPTVEGDATQLQQVVMNLCLNARDAMPDGGTLTIETSLCDSATLATAHGPIWRPGPFVRLMIRDTGIGMTKETVHRVFDPFFTTKEKGKGTGLGLALVYGVIKNHGGCVDVQSTPGGGASFQCYLPASDALPAALDTPVAVPAVGRRSGCILVVDDDQVVRSLVRDILEPHGYRVLLAEDGLAAVELFGVRHAEIDLVILDMLMPRMDGLQAYFAMRDIDPALRVVLCTGYSQDHRAGELLRTGAVGFLRKPYDPAELLAAVEGADRP